MAKLGVLLVCVAVLLQSMAVAALSVGYSEHAFNSLIETAMVDIERVLMSNKQPMRAADVPHSYNDKYVMADFLTNSMVSAMTTSLNEVLPSKDSMQKILDWVSATQHSPSFSSATLAFHSEEESTFVQTTTKLVESGVTEQVEEVTTSSFFTGEPNTKKKVRTSKVFTNVTETTWNVTVASKLVIELRQRGESDGTGHISTHVLWENANSIELITPSAAKTSPRHSYARAPRPLVVDITWLLHQIIVPKGPVNADTVYRGNVTVDRSHAECYTPRRNPEVLRALQTGQVLHYWSQQVRNMFDTGKYRELSFMNLGSGDRQVVFGDLTRSVFVPIAPIMFPEDDAEGSDSAASGAVGAESGAGERDKEAEEGSWGACNGSCNAKFPSAPQLEVLLGKERDTLRAHIQQASQVFRTDSNTKSIINPEMAAFLVTLGHLQDVVVRYEHSMHYLELMIERQLVDAIGKSVTPADLNRFVNNHHMNKNVLRSEYAAKPFSYAIRRSAEHSPEGYIAIEQDSSATQGHGQGQGHRYGHRHGNMAEAGGGEPKVTPIATISRELPTDSLDQVREMNGTRSRTLTTLPNTGMQFALNAASSVSFSGDTHVHTWLHHIFSNGGDQESSQIHRHNSPVSSAGLTFVAEARQFSSYIVLMGRIPSPTSFIPSHGIIVKDKDLLRIPLDIELIPSSKAFKAAIQSLSPEQQSFAKAFRSMQLESTLFGICIIQIKPQLERVLNLPPNSLTKEIKLTQDLMDLFINYQIPSDLLSFSTQDAGLGGLVDSEASNSTQLVAAGESLGQVKLHVEAMKSMIKVAKEEELAERKQEHLYSHPEMMSAAPRMTKRRSPSAEPAGMPASMPSSAPVTISSGEAVFATLSSVSSHASLRGGDSFSLEGGGGGEPEAAAADADDGTAVNQDASSVAERSFNDGSSEALSQVQHVDFTSFPQVLDKRFEMLMQSGSLHTPTGNASMPHTDRITDERGINLQAAIIHPGSQWSQRRQKGLIAGGSGNKGTPMVLLPEQQKEEKNAAFELLDALTRGGALGITHSTLHVLIAAAHSFDKTLMGTLVEDNINPIDKIESSLLVMASTVHGRPVGELVQEAHRLHNSAA